ncbi:hypothetical protein T265_04600 [Opisthorchis viverrini]|uniref:cystathionine gamma-lyase n=1 Tax=Opisthorchis viverrini TaxID=6198 RepID=A0A074ZS73_OPIVI|nr:hypothetical protein T265_04600 [Opisthorchis viverrini]KER28652.1 hypothetical protein T265_04600 [Opisthorchis viverrini]
MEEFEAAYKEALHQAKIFITENFRPFESIETIATHGGFYPHDLSCMGSPVVPPICLSTTFEQKEPGVARYDYSRAGNFSRECLEKCIAELECGDHCSTYSSGLACLGAIVQLLSAGDHIVAFDDMYGVNSRLCAVRLSSSIKLNASRHKKRCLLVVSAYAPTNCSPDAEKDTFYRELSEFIHQAKNTDIVILAGDLNAQVGRLSSLESHLGGHFGVDARRTDNGDRLLQLCADHELFLARSGRYLRTIANRSGISCTLVDMRDEDAFKSVLQPNTKLVLAETPSNPLMRLIDIRRISDIAHNYNKDIIVAVDNTFMTPYFQRPLDFGADISWHSLTKYMNGHSDVVMGAVVTRGHPELPSKFKFAQLAGGAVPSSFDCFLCLRGLRTLPVRMRGHMLNALVVAKMLEKHPKVEKVIHPALPSHPQHKLALEQMRGFSGIISVYVKCTAEETVEFVKNIKLNMFTANELLSSNSPNLFQVFALAESLGGYESLIEIPSIMTHISVPYEIRLQNGISDNMIRLSIGLEDPKDLVRALYEGLDALDGKE